MEKTANVSNSITMTAMLHSHQSRFSSFRSSSWTSARRVSDEESYGWANVSRIESYSCLVLNGGRDRTPDL